MLIVALFIVALKWKHPGAHPQMNKFLKMWFVHTVEYYAAIKKNKMLTRATPWMTLENISLRERSQTQKCHTAYDSIYIKSPE